MKVTFHNNTQLIGLVTPVRPVSEIADEPMLYSASPEFAMKHGGPITKEAMEAISLLAAIPGSDPDYPHRIVDTRVHMLMPGQYPAIPGWHCDCTPRAGYWDQPNPLKASEGQRNYSVFVSTEEGVGKMGIAPTVFAQGGTIIEYDEDHVWKSVDEVMREREQKRHIKTLAPKNGEIAYFTGQTLHKATPAIIRGWRYFFRLSFMANPPQDKIRKQVQVYTGISQGW